MLPGPVGGSGFVSGCSPSDKSDRKTAGVCPRKPRAFTQGRAGTGSWRSSAVRRTLIWYMWTLWAGFSISLPEWQSRRKSVRFIGAEFIRSLRGRGQKTGRNRVPGSGDDISGYTPRATGVKALSIM